VEKVIARRAAMELRGGMVANLGFGISAMVPRILLEEGHPEAVTWAIEQGAVGGMPLTGFAFGCASNAWGYVPSPQQFIYFQGGGFDVSFLSFLEVDAQGNVNVSKLGKKPYLTAGCGGFVDITAHARKIVFAGWFEAGAQIALTDRGITVERPGKFTKMVDRGRARHLFRQPGPGTGSGRAVRHRTLRDAAGCRGPCRDRDHAGHRPRPRHRGGKPWSRAAGRGCGCDAAFSVVGRARWGGSHERRSPSYLGGMAELRLDNPTKLNAFTVEMLRQMADHLDTVEHNPAIACVLVTATPPAPSAPGPTSTPGAT
jgi:acyl CoA:acetate/3-ketoacid CoA transferase beta subunit